MRVGEYRVVIATGQIVQIVQRRERWWVGDTGTCYNASDLAPVPLTQRAALDAKVTEDRASAALAREFMAWQRG